MKCGKCGNANCGSECHKQFNWWGNQFGYNPNGYSNAPVVQQNWWNEQFAPQVIGVGETSNAQLTIEIEKCAQAAYNEMATNGDLQALYNGGYTDSEVRSLLKEACIEQILQVEDESESILYSPIEMKAWVLTLAFLGTTTLGGIIGYMVGRR